MENGTEIKIEKRPQNEAQRGQLGAPSRAGNRPKTAPQGEVKIKSVIRRPLGPSWCQKTVPT